MGEMSPKAEVKPKVSALEKKIAVIAQKRTKVMTDLRASIAKRKASMHRQALVLKKEEMMLEELEK